ncbi:MAG: hypothetical protein ACKVIR_01590 [Candidatus Poseidoniales archaeon]
MAKPSAVQITLLDTLREFVIEVMTGMDIWNKDQLTSLMSLDLGVLRKSATQRHGVTRWKLGIRNPSNAQDVEVIDLHPRLLTDEWQAYSAWVLHHEFIHALGFLPHNSTFRALEKLWPSQKSGELGRVFTETLRRERASWLWICPKCTKEYPRQKRGRGKFICKACKVPLLDKPNDGSM